MPYDNCGDKDETQVDPVIKVPSVDGVENALKVFGDKENVNSESPDLHVINFTSILLVAVSNLILLIKYKYKL